MSDVILSCATCCFRGRGRDEIAETLQYAPAAGYQAIGIGGPFTVIPGLMQWFDAAAFQRRVAATGMTLTEIWSPPLPTDSFESAERGAEELGYIVAMLETLGCTRMVQTGGKRRDDGLEKTIHGLRQVARSIAGRPIQICLEPHVGSQILLPEDYARIFDEVDSPQVGMTLDTGHFHSGGIDMIALIERFPDRIWNVHLKDHIGAQSVPIGTGDVDLRGVFVALRAIDYQGPIALELETTNPENAPQDITDAYRYLNPLLRDVGLLRAGEGL